MNQNELLRVEELHISLQMDKGSLPVVNGISFGLKKGQILALVGESGCGKSVTSLSLMRLLGKGLEISGGQILFRHPESGDVTDIAALGSNDKAMRKLRGDQIAMIFQEPMSSFSPLHTIGEQIMEVVRLHRKVSKLDARKRAIELLDKVGIADPAQAVDRYPHEFSGGQRQRAMIARALACDPSVLVADEPTTALDVTIQAQILKLLKDLQQEMGMAIIFITHDLGLVAQMADEVAIMYMGNVVEHGATRAIFKQPQHPYTKRLLQAIPRLGVIQDKLQSIEGSVPNLFERPVGCAFNTRCTEQQRDACQQRLPALRSIELINSVADIAQQNASVAVAQASTETAKVNIETSRPRDFIHSVACHLIHPEAVV